ncbi:hypothetical protein TEQG_01275 [Trichophyton equinum CBS 127.97]|uniref:Methyltransferase type 11 domain-containing protein n=1 Tax=Trichophyton equinum (strain ATCC MYA-4606 / CBS 127.97) TaxID=559882 RepID=F2PK16_TRIEC|nr:hypothetical protein TEQG_01275 [Trichophyton equinum CBS 127.97]
MLNFNSFVSEFNSWIFIGGNLNWDSPAGGIQLAPFNRKNAKKQLARLKDWVSTRPNIRIFDGTLEKLPFSAEQFDVVLVSWQLEFAVDMEAALGEILRVTRKTMSSRILFIQGAPDNEFIRFLNTTSGLPNVRHQGYLLHFAKEYAARHGFGKATVSHIKAHYAFPDQDISKRCRAAVNLLGGNTASMVDKELFPRLELHFRGSQHAIGHNMAMLDMRLTAN